MEDIDQLKLVERGEPRYRLARANVYVSPGGHHYIDYLDPLENLSPEIDASALTPDKIEYIEKTLQSNEAKFQGQARIVQKFAPQDKQVIDIGCGGGLFLSLMQAHGARVTGVELSDARAQYAISNYKIPVIKRTIENEYWEQYAGTYDVCTLWDVIEHVNFPGSTVKAASRLLKKGGLIFIDTPCRESFYHRAGELTYRISFGKYPTFLNAMYSARPFGHKQIFSARELSGLLEAAGFEIVALQRFHELSFPYEYYLQRIFKSKRFAAMVLPFVDFLLRIFPVKNKMLVVGRKL